MSDLTNLDPDTLKDMAKVANQYLGEIAKSPLQEFGGLIADKVKYWRASLQLKQLEKLTKKIKKAGFVPNKLEMKVLFPCLEGISLEEDEQMQDRWTDLMLNYVDPSVNLKLAVYPEILKQLSTPEIKTLNYVIDNQSKNISGVMPLIIKGRKAQFFGEAAIIDVDVCSNLERLGLIKEIINRPEMVFLNEDEDFSMPTATLESGAFKITNFGIEFVKACTRP